MKKRLFIYTILIIFTGLAVFFAATVFITRNNNFNIAKDSVIEITEICAGIFAEFYDGSESISFESFGRIGDNTRITIISSDGTVLADSRPIDLRLTATHLDRPEVQAALNNAPQADIRYSSTLGTNMIYYALKVNVAYGDDAGFVFVRASIPVEGVDAYLYHTLVLLVLILIVLAILCFVFTGKMANRVTEPFSAVEKKLRSLSEARADGEYVSEPIEGSYEEFNRILAEINSISLVLQDSFGSLSDEKNKLDYILSNIGDGIFTVDSNCNVTLINNSALEIFEVNRNVIGKDMVYLTSNKSLTETVRNCVVSQNSVIFEISHVGKTFLVTIKQLPAPEFTMVALSDVTENRENAKRREEFFANASHELKTPLTAIKGFNELTEIHNKDENIRKYVAGITRETERMLTLIGDMLKLSELENSEGVNPVPVLLSDVVKDVRETMSTALNEKEIVFKTSGDITIHAEQSHVYEVVKNLIENAVRYNVQGGEVNVISTEGELVVSDNGIGIPDEEHSRIFERFYRVEKCRSERNGGTGLGLSIVKHICALYDWELKLKSKIGTGTEVVIKL